MGESQEYDTTNETENVKEDRRERARPIQLSSENELKK